MTNKAKARKRYEKPAMQVFELKQHARLLVVSGDGGLDPLNPYNPGGDPLS